MFSLALSMTHEFKAKLKAKLIYLSAEKTSKHVFSHLFTLN